jgi:lysophospholipase L1-like esterase
VRPGYFTLVAIFIIVLQLAIVYLIYYRLIVKRIFSLPKGNPKQFAEQMKNNPTNKFNKKRIIFIGDSITHGISSINFIEMVAKELGEDNFDYINGGLNASLTYNVLQRLDDIIACKPDFVIIMIGTNDAHRSMKLYKPSITDRRLHLPREPDKEWFIENLQKILFELQQKTNAKIALCSLPPLGEDTTHDAFYQIIDYSKTIKVIAENMEVNYIPVNERLVEYLELNPSNPKYPTEHKLFGIAAVKQYILGMSLDKMSRKYGFSLLVDHLHLNTIGAKMVAELIIGFIKEN